MQNNLFIPKKLKIGFQNRDDTFTGKLAYIIYYDTKNVLRKEKSWKSWISQKIDTLELDNTPIEGLTINRDIKRYNWGHFSSNRTMIRVHDPRGFEFEITTENLIGILMNTDCLKRGLYGSFVYAWSGTELVLLPVVCEEYQQAEKFTALQGKTFSARKLVPGMSYITKQQEELLYLGYYNWHTFHRETTSYIIKKKHIFASSSKYWSTQNKTSHKYNVIAPRSSITNIAEQTSTSEVAEYPIMLKAFSNSIRSSKILRVEATNLKTVYQRDLVVEDAKKFGGVEVKIDNILCFRQPNMVEHLTISIGSYWSNHNYNKLVECGTQIVLSPFKLDAAKIQRPLSVATGDREYTVCDLLFTFENGTTRLVSAKQLNNFYYELQNQELRVENIDAAVYESVED
jgi:hypothetical protein